MFVLMYCVFSDMFIKAELTYEDSRDRTISEAQSSDTHWRCADGKGSFNFRMKWDVELPSKFFRLTLQAWDRDLLLVGGYYWKV
jgi:hypothetical protein